MAEKINTKKSLTQNKKRLSVEQEWDLLQKDKAKWEKEKIKRLNEIDNYYETHEGGMFYRWFSDECWYAEMGFQQREKAIKRRELREAKKESTQN